MKKLLLATVFMLAAASANAGTITFTAQEDAGPTTTLNTGVATSTIGPFTVGDFTVNSLSGSTTPAIPGPDLLQANTIDVEGASTLASHTLHLTVLANGLTSPTGLQQILSEFSAVGLTTGWSATLSTDINGVTQATNTFTNTGGVNIPGTFNFSSPFFVSAHFDLTNNMLAGSANVGTEFQAVPGPIVGAGIPGLLAALGMLGFNRWRKRRVA